MFQGVLILCNVSRTPLPLQCFRESSSFAMFQGLLFAMFQGVLILCNVSRTPLPLQCFKDSSSFAMFEEFFSIAMFQGATSLGWWDQQAGSYLHLTAGWALLLYLHLFHLYWHHLAMETLHLCIMQVTNASRGWYVYFLGGLISTAFSQTVE